MTQPIPVDFDQLYPGRFLKAGLFLGKERTLTITKIDLEALPDDKGVEKKRGILTFQETDMQLALNRTNGECIKAMFGKALARWIGKRVTFKPDMDNFGRERVACIRVAGSPDIAEDVRVEVSLPKRKAKPYTLTRTVLKGAAHTTPSREPGDD